MTGMEKQLTHIEREPMTTKPIRLSEVFRQYTIDWMESKSPTPSDGTEALRNLGASTLRLASETADTPQ